MPSRLLIATTNRGKFVEIRRLFRESGVELRLFTPGDLNLLSHGAEPGGSFEEIAMNKALHYSRQVKDCLVAAEDSGLVVEALNGAPGIYSSRYAGEECSDLDNINKLLAELSGQKNRKARFVATVALAMGDQVIKTFSGEVEGEILEQPRGNGGFGYDPVFYFPSWNQSFGEVDRFKKNTLSHRKQAFEKLIKFLLS